MYTSVESLDTTNYRPPGPQHPRHARINGWHSGKSGSYTACRLLQDDSKAPRTAARPETTRDATSNPNKMKSPPAAPAAGAYSAVSRKLMASMGWTEGKGLGKHEQGADKHIEHKKRGDNVGLGADATVEAQFLSLIHI